VKVFAGARRQELDELLTSYPTKMAALLPALWIVQEERGWVSGEAMAEVAELLELTPAYVKGVVSFYTMYHQHPVGRHFIQVCTTSPCNVCGAEDVVNALLKHTGCEELGVTSADGKYTVIEVECLGACGFATPVMVNEQFIESVTPDTVPALLASLR
jgi:NADH-quinone oxidoreductase E subunit